MFLHNTQWNCFCNHVFQWGEEKYCNLPNIEREMLVGWGNYQEVRKSWTVYATYILWYHLK